MLCTQVVLFTSFNWVGSDGEEHFWGLIEKSLSMSFAIPNIEINDSKIRRKGVVSDAMISDVVIVNILASFICN